MRNIGLAALKDEQRNNLQIVLYNGNITTEPVARGRMLQELLCIFFDRSWKAITTSDAGDGSSERAVFIDATVQSARLKYADEILNYILKDIACSSVRP